MSKTHELPEGRTTTVYDVWAVYKSYDANAPDTETLVWCATEDLARGACDMLSESEDNDDEVTFGEEVYELCKPHCDGFEGCSSYECAKVVVPEESKDQIARSLRDVARIRQS